MSLSTEITIVGFVKLEVVDARGELVACERVRNTVTNGGLNVMRDLLLGSVGQYPRAIAGGTDDGTALPLAATNTALGAEVFRKIILRRDSSDKTAKFQTILLTTEGNGSTYEEVGLFTSTADDAAILVARAQHTGIAKTSSNQITYTWELQIG